jgi:hypothetical protein
VTSPLDNLADIGSLKKEAPDADEYRGLIHSGTVRLSDAQKTNLSLESRFDLAYNASHSLSLAALRRAGYRSSNRYIVFQALEHTLGIDSAVWRVLAKCHQVRNQGEYEGDLNIDEQLVKELVVACRTVADALSKLSPLPKRPLGR